MAELSFRSDHEFTFICEHCKRVKSVPTDKVPTCGFPLVFQCKQCDCITRISNRKGEFQAAFDSFSAYYAKENPRMFETCTVQFDGLDESLVPDEWEKYFDDQQVKVPGLLQQIEELFHRPNLQPADFMRYDIPENWINQPIVEKDFIQMAANIKNDGS